MPGAMSFECPHRPECPGCELLELSYPEQLAARRSALRDALDAYPLLRQVAVADPWGTDEVTAYRTRAKWVVDGPRIGLYGPGHVVVDTPSCLAAPLAALRVAEALRGRPPEPVGAPARLAALDVRHTLAGETVVILVVEAWDEEAARVHAVSVVG